MLSFFPFFSLEKIGRNTCSFLDQAKTGMPEHQNVRTTPHAALARPSHVCCAQHDPLPILPPWDKSFLHANPPRRFPLPPSVVYTSWIWLLVSVNRPDQSPFSLPHPRKSHPPHLLSHPKPVVGDDRENRPQSHLGPFVGSSPRAPC